MGIAKEIFGLLKKGPNGIQGTSYDLGKINGYNETLQVLDQFEISEEAIAIILQDITYKSDSEYKKLDANATREVAKAIKTNANKIFVRRGK